MTGHVYITEYNNMGDVQWEIPMEPAQRCHRVAIGEVSEPTDKASRFIVLLASAPCRVAFVPDGENIEDAESHAFPLAAETETLRLVHMNTVLRIATYEREDEGGHDHHDEEMGAV
jgi:hypothetical protein